MNPSLTGSKPADRLPPLREGERVGRTEFERRYESMPHVKKAELIEGRVFMASPAPQDQHGRQQAQLNGWLFLYHAGTPGVDIGDNSSWRIDEENEPQPDGLLRIEESAGGGSTIDAQGYLRGAIEFAAEIAASSSSHDLGPKLRLYQRCQTPEYLVWRVRDGEIDWFELRGDRYERKEPDQDGVLRSEVLPGLWLEPRAMVEGDMPRAIAVLQQGLASKEHADFVARLQAEVQRRKTGDGT